MRRKRFLTVVAVIIAALSALSAGVTSAAPVKAPKASDVDMSCASNDFGINTITAVVMDSSTWASGHIVAINGEPASMTGIPLEFQGTVTDSTTGTVVATFDQVKPGNRNGINNTLKCTISDSFTDDQGNTFTVTNTITLFIASLR